MKVIKSLFPAAAACMILLACRVPDSSVSGYPATNPADPAPVPPGVIETLPSPPDDFYITANAGGRILYFSAAAPQNFEIIASDACTDDKYSDVSLSEDRRHIMYARNNSDGTKDLVVVTLNDNGTAANTDVVQENIASNESEFLNYELIQYSHDSRIRIYSITGKASRALVDDARLACNHGAAVSPDLKKIVIKEQNPNNLYSASFAWTGIDVTSETAADNCSELNFEYTNYVNLTDSFEFRWLDGNRFLMKDAPGVTDTSFVFDLADNASRKSLQVSAGNTPADYSKTAISDDLQKVLFFGNFGLYYYNLSEDWKAG